MTFKLGELLDSMRPPDQMPEFVSHREAMNALDDDPNLVMTGSAKAKTKQGLFKKSKKAPS